jgi:hypothetical protein
MLALWACFMAGDLEASTRTLDRTAASVAVSDGFRYVSYLSGDGTPLVFDSVEGSETRIRDAEGCEPRTVGAGRALLDCAPGEDYSEYVLRPTLTASVRTGESMTLRNAVQRDTFYEIGKYWAFGHFKCQSPSCTGPIYLNLRTGERVRQGPGDLVEFSLDHEQLRPECRPDFIDRLNGRIIATHDRNFVVTDDGRTLRLWSSRTKSRVLGPGNGLGIRIANQRVTWISGSTLHSVALKPGDGSYTQKLASANSFVAPVKGGAVVSVGRKSGGSLSYTINLVTFPR